MTDGGDVHLAPVQMASVPRRTGLERHSGSREGALPHHGRNWPCSNGPSSPPGSTTSRNEHPGQRAAIQAQAEPVSLEITAPVPYRGL